MLSTRDRQFHQLLEEIENGRGLTQRLLARRLGVALGLANLLIRRLVRKGLIRVIQIRPNRVSYLITPAGLAEKARMSRDALAHSVRFYAGARDRIGERFQQLSDSWPALANQEKRIVFYGAGEVAEIGYVCVHSTDLKLVGVVDAAAPRRFFGMDVSPLAALRGAALADMPFERLVVMSFGDRADIERQLDSLAFPPDRVFWI